MANLKNVTKNTFFYTFSSVLLRAFSIIFFPIFSLYLTKEDYGILSISQSLIGILTIIGSLELNKSLTRFIYSRSELNRESLISTIAITLFGATTIMVAVVLLIGPFLLRFVLKDIPFYPYITLFLLSIPFNSVVEFYRMYLVANHQGMKTFNLNMAFFTTNILLNLFFVVVLKMNVLGIILGITVNAILYSVIAYILFFRHYPLRFDKYILKSILSYSTPLIPYSILNILFDSVDRFFLNADSGAEASGIYYIALTFATIFSTLKESLIHALTPWIFQHIKTSSESYLQKVMIYAFLWVGIGAMGLSWFSREILQVLSSNPEFVEAYQYIPYIVVSLYIIFLGQLYNIKTFYFGKYNRYLFLATLTGILVDALICYYLIPMIGTMGAVYARMSAFIFQVLVVIIISRLEKEKSAIYHLPAFLIITVIIAGLSLSVLLPHPIFSLWWLKIIIGIIIFYFLGRHTIATFHLQPMIADKIKSWRGK